MSADDLLKSICFDSITIPSVLYASSLSPSLYRNRAFIVTKHIFGLYDIFLNLHFGNILYLYLLSDDSCALGTKSPWEVGPSTFLYLGLLFRCFCLAVLCLLLPSIRLSSIRLVDLRSRF